MATSARKALPSRGTGFLGITRHFCANFLLSYAVTICSSGFTHVKLCAWRNSNMTAEDHLPGGAPLLKSDKAKLSRDSKFARIVDHLRKQLAASPAAAEAGAPPSPGASTPQQQVSVFTYLKSSFSPSLEESVGVLLDAFGTDGKLYVYYGLVPAWG